jgi:hypothetical protein
MRQLKLDEHGIIRISDDTSGVLGGVLGTMIQDLLDQGRRLEYINQLFTPGGEGYSLHGFCGAYQLVDEAELALCPAFVEPWVIYNDYAKGDILIEGEELRRLIRTAAALCTVWRVSHITAGNNDMPQTAPLNDQFILGYLSYQNPKTGEMETRRIPTSSRLLLGRSEDNDICLKHPFIARHHAMFEANESAVFVVAFGVGFFVNGKLANKNQKLSDGDIIEVAGMQIRFRESRHKPSYLDLWEAVGLWLIIEWPSGVAYTNQVGGRSCAQLTQEGLLVPLSSQIPDLREKALYEHFTGPKWRGNCYNGIDDETAQFIEGLFVESDFKGIEVDRARLHQSMEAWIFVRVNSPFLGVIFGFPEEGLRGVLTWENSD